MILNVGPTDSQTVYTEDSGRHWGHWRSSQAVSAHRANDVCAYFPDVGQVSKRLVADGVKTQFTRNASAFLFEKDIVSIKVGRSFVAKTEEWIYTRRPLFHRITNVLSRRQILPKTRKHPAGDTPSSSNIAVVSVTLLWNFDQKASIKEATFLTSLRSWHD